MGTRTKFTCSGGSARDDNKVSLGHKHDEEGTIKLPIGAVNLSFWSYKYAVDIRGIDTVNQVDVRLT